MSAPEIVFDFAMTFWYGMARWHWSPESSLQATGERVAPSYRNILWAANKQFYAQLSLDVDGAEVLGVEPIFGVYKAGFLGRGG